MQEPYLYKNHIALMGKNLVFPDTDLDYILKTGVVILNNKLNVIMITQFTNKYFTTINLNKDTQNFYIINGYVPPTGDLDEAIDFLEITIKTLHPNPILITGDLNAKSPVWQSEQEDNRGKLVVEFINKYDLHYINTSPLPTFQTINGKGWTDIIFANKQFINYGMISETTSEITVSDHNYIRITIDGINNDNTNNDKQ